MHAVRAEALVYIPAAQSPHKLESPPTEAKHRLAMVRLMVKDMPFATVLTDEIDRFAASGGQPSYTIDTLTQLRKKLGPQVKMRLLIGTDQLKSFDRWREYERIIELAEPVVMMRPPQTRESILAELPSGLKAKDWAGRFVETPVMDVSATMIRQRVAAGQSIAEYVTPEVAAYIRENGLYRTKTC